MIVTSEVAVNFQFYTECIDQANEQKAFETISMQQFLLTCMENISNAFIKCDDQCIDDELK